MFEHAERFWRVDRVPSSIYVRLGYALVFIQKFGAGDTLGYVGLALVRIHLKIQVDNCVFSLGSVRLRLVLHRIQRFRLGSRVSNLMPVRFGFGFQCIQKFEVGDTVLSLVYVNLAQVFEGIQKCKLMTAYTLRGTLRQDLPSNAFRNSG